MQMANDHAVDPAEKQDYLDKIVWERASSPKFDKLWAGQWQGFYPSQSEADSALVYMLARQTNDMRQIERMFLASGLGERLRTGQKKKHKNYVFDMVNDAMRDKPPIANIELDGEWKPQVQIESVPLPVELDTDEDAPLLNLYPEPIARFAYSGLAGEFCDAMKDISEADRNVLLPTFLQVAGAIIGSNPYVRLAENAIQHTNFFTALVGETNKGKKGTASRNVLGVMKLVDPQFIDYRILRGMSTGEGLIHAVRDAKDKDPGEPDKRLFALAEELVLVFRQMERIGNTLSPTLREAWDHGNLATATRTNAMRATNPHIAMQGHITKAELIEHFPSGIIYNGFANRFLWLCSQRDKLLALPPEWNYTSKFNYAMRLAGVINHAKLVQQVRFDEDAEEFYRHLYIHEFNKEADSVQGALNQRGPAMLTRLAMIYALLDESQLPTKGPQGEQPIGEVFMTETHLEASLAIWRYNVDSALYIFSGDDISNGGEAIVKLIAANDAQGIVTPKTAIYRQFNGNKTKDQINAVLKVLLNKELIEIAPPHGKAQEFRLKRGK